MIGGKISCMRSNGSIGFREPFIELIVSQPRMFSQMRNLNMQRFVSAKFLQKFSQMRFLGLMLLEYLCAKPHVCPKGFL